VARRPLIGVSASMHDFGDYGGVGVHRPLLDAGGISVVLPQLVDAVRTILDAVDGIVLAPGRDIEPLRYGQEPHSLLAATEPQRDAFELALVAQALDRGMPILGMCRGVQLLNVALGGTLVQDVSLVAAGHPSDPGWTRGQLVPPPGDRSGRRGAGGRRSEQLRRTARGGRAARAPGARGAVGAAGGVAGRSAVRARVLVVRGRGTGRHRELLTGRQAASSDSACEPTSGGWRRRVGGFNGGHLRSATAATFQMRNRRELARPA
jgi:hypothetical protein